ncbi:MAG: calcium-binding protein [Nitrospiria bacterium]
MEKSDKGNLPRNEDAFDKIYAEWEKRLWEPWLRNNLKFPFPIERMEDDDDAYFTDIAKSEPFRLGHIMEAIDIEIEDDHHGIILKVKEGKRVGHVPLCDVEVTSKENDNFWSVREYVVWFANQ